MPNNSNSNSKLFRAPTTTKKTRQEMT